ncbi:uncharacterized protein LOC144354656 [Saccoglossus kowalevskii]
MEQLYRECNFSELKDHQKYVVLVHDELRIHADLVFEKSSGQLVGFVDMGDFNNSLAAFEKDINYDGFVKPDVATYMLVFMNGEHIVWKTVEDLYKADLERSGALFLYCTTIEFIRNVDKFFDCLNVRSFTEAVKKRKPNLKPYSSPDDPRLKWLKEEFLGYLTKWSDKVDARYGLSKSEKNRMKLSAQTIEGIFMTVNSFVEVTQYLLNQPGIVCVLSEKFNQDPLERYFGNHRQMKEGNESLSVQQFWHTSNTLQLRTSNMLRVHGSNVRGPVADGTVDNTPLPKRRRR